MVFLAPFAKDTLKEDLKRFVNSKDKQTEVKQKKTNFEKEPFNEYEEEFYEANVKNYRIDSRFDKRQIEKGSLPPKYKMNINYPHLKKDVKAWSLSCC